MNDVYFFKMADQCVHIKGGKLKTGYFDLFQIGEFFAG